jgi:imidazolonepropionase-like amidohydrolase
MTGRAPRGVLRGNLRFQNFNLKLTILFLALLVAVCICAAVPAPSSFAITGAKVYTLAGAPQDNAAILIRDGKIAAIGAHIEIPAGAQVIDAKGLEVYPGFFDPITQMGLSEISAVSATVDSAETGLFNPDVVAATAVNPESAHIPVTRADGITDVVAVPASGMDFSGSRGVIGGQASALHLSGWTSEELVTRRSVAMVINWPSIETRTFDFTTFNFKTKPFSEAKTEYEKNVMELTEWFDRARHYSQALEKGSRRNFERDLKLEALVPVIRGELPALVFANRSRDIRSAVEFCDKQKVKMILAGGSEAYKVKDLLKSKNIPVILKPTLRAPDEEDDPYDRAMTEPAELAAAGIQIAFASFDNSFARRLGQFAGAAVAYGLSRDQALKAVTLNPAQIFGLDKELGTLEVGKTANLIITTGDPLDVTTQVRYVFIKGQLTSLDNRHLQLFQHYSQRP